MKDKHIDRQQFWDQKIVGWEDDKYKPANGLLGRFLDVNHSVKYRLEVAKKVLKQAAKDGVVLEMGCGTAQLFPEIIKGGAKKYIGVDISKVAIEQARAKAKEMGMSRSTEFYQLDGCHLDEMNPDICFSLGLLDWMEPEEIVQMLDRIRCRYYLHSFSELRRSFQQMLHRFYVYCMYGHRTHSYVPKYYSRKQIVEMFSASYKDSPNYFRSKEMSFGSFIYQLPEWVQWSS